MEHNKQSVNSTVSCSASTLCSLGTSSPRGVRRDAIIPTLPRKPWNDPEGPTGPGVTPLLAVWGSRGPGGGQGKITGVKERLRAVVSV